MHIITGAKYISLNLPLDPLPRPRISTHRRPREAAASSRSAETQLYRSSDSDCERTPIRLRKHSSFWPMPTASSSERTQATADLLQTVRAATCPA